jgi:hypothetical protein
MVPDRLWYWLCCLELSVEGLKFIEYQSICPFVGIGSPHPRKRVCPRPLDPKMGSNTGFRGLIRTTGQKVRHSVYPVELSVGSHAPKFQRAFLCFYSSYPLWLCYAHRGCSWLRFLRVSVLKYTVGMLNNMYFDLYIPTICKSCKRYTKTQQWWHWLLYWIREYTCYTNR